MATFQRPDTRTAVLPLAASVSAPFISAAVVTASDALARGLRPEQLRAAADWSFAKAAAVRDDWRRRKRLRRQGLALMRSAEQLQASRDRHLFVLLGGVDP